MVGVSYWLDKDLISLVLVVIWVKTFLLALSPKPNSPNSLYPVHHNVPSFFNIKVWLPPQ